MTAETEVGAAVPHGGPAIVTRWKRFGHDRLYVKDASGIDPESGTVHFRRPGVKHVEATETGWLPVEGPVRIGVTAGASTPIHEIEK